MRYPAIPPGKADVRMTRFERSLLLVLALGCGTGCTAASQSVRSLHSNTSVKVSSAPHSIQDAPSLAQTTSAQVDTAAATTPAGRRMDSTVVVILCLAVVAGLIFLVAR